jgi:predicted dinucleotide-binding enzyme
VIEATNGRAREATPADATRDADVVVLTVPWSSVDDALASGLALDGKVLLVVTLPWTEESDALALGTTTSGAEYIAPKAPGARVVNAFNTVASATVAAPRAHGEPATVIVSGDDAGAKAVVVGLARELGFDAVDAGPLRVARYTEPMAMLWASLALDQGLGEDVAFRVLRRSE